MDSNKVKMKSCRSLSLVVVAACVSAVHGFTFSKLISAPSSLCHFTAGSSSSNGNVCLRAIRRDDGDGRIASTPGVASLSSPQNYDQNKQEQHTTTSVEYTALLPGHRLPIQIGSLSLARKAWKKRRRSYSPILVPCSLLSIPHTKSTLRNNVMYLLHKYGQDLAAINSHAIADAGGGKGGGAGVFLSMNKLVSLYRKVLGGDLSSHAIALGYQSLESFLTDIMDSQTKFKYGAELIDYQPWNTESNEDNSNDGNEDSSRSIMLVSSLPKRQAREWVSKTALAQIQFSTAAETKSDHEPSTTIDNHDAISTMMPHTGKVKTYYNAPVSEHNKKKMRHFSLVPLSAALRIQQQQPRAINSSTGSKQQQMQDEQQQQQQQQAIAGLVEGETLYAYVLQYDATGDDGSPLITFSFDRRDKVETKIRRNIIASQQEARQFKKSLLDKGILTSTSSQKTNNNVTRRSLTELQFGEGPILARVARISARSNAAFVDVGVFRQKGKNSGGGLVQVLGMLRFKELMDATDSGSTSTEEAEEIMFNDDQDEQWFSAADFEDDNGDKNAKTIDDLFTIDDDDDEDEEEEEDLTDVYGTDEDGMLYEIDQETGEKIMLQDDDDDDDDSLINDDDVVMAANMKRMIDQTKMVAEKASSPTSEKKRVPNFLQIGDELNVYVNMVSLQSGRFMVTLDPSVQGKSGKEIKKQANVEKRLSKLTERYGHDGLNRILSLKGTECFGIIKATSQKGIYVQPDLLELPVGVASGYLDDDEIKIQELLPGDRVRIQLDGIDDSRGQLAVKLLGKLSP